MRVPSTDPLLNPLCQQPRICTMSRARLKAAGLRWGEGCFGAAQLIEMLPGEAGWLGELAICSISWHCSC